MVQDWRSFALSGTEKALASGLHPVTAALLGMLTGIGGGMILDRRSNLDRIGTHRGFLGFVQFAQRIGRGS
jgi:hypothetical protein